MISNTKLRWIRADGGMARVVICKVLGGFGVIVPYKIGNNAALVLGRRTDQTEVLEVAQIAHGFFDRGNGCETALLGEKGG